MQANPAFLDKVTTWQRKLGTVDLVLGTWSDMQKKWQALVSIFLGSADIRDQLPEDSQRFDAVNANFKACLDSTQPVMLLTAWQEKRCAEASIFEAVPFRRT